MTREEAQEHFWQNCARQVCKDALAQTDQYFREHKARLAEEFAVSFIAFCRQIRQESGRKGKVRHIFYSMLYTALIQEQPAWRIDAYDENGYWNDKECSTAYEAAWLFKPLHEACRHLDRERRKYVGLIGPGHIDIIKRLEAAKYRVYLEIVARQGLKQAVRSEEFAAIAKDEAVDIHLGEYLDKHCMVYMHDIAQKDGTATKKWLEEKLENDYICEVLTELDLSYGDYAGIELSYARMNKSIFKDVDLRDALIYGADFSRCSIEDSDFSHCGVSGTIFDGAVIKGTDFRLSHGQERDIIRQEDESEEDELLAILDGVSFQHSKLEDVNLAYTLLDYADFSGANLKEVSFANSDLVQTTFHNAELIDCDFSGADLTGAQFNNAVFSGCTFKEANLQGTIFSRKTNLDSLGLNETQKKEIIYVESLPRTAQKPSDTRNALSGSPTSGVSGYDSTMKYFILIQDSRFIGPAVPTELKKNIPKRVLGKYEALQLAEAMAFPVSNNKNWEYGAIIDRPVYLINNGVKELFERYDRNIVFNAIMLNDQKNNEQHLYWMMGVTVVDCLAGESVFNPDCTIRKLVLDESKILTKPIFKIGGLREEYLVIRLDVAESLLRRDFYGIELRPILTIGSEDNGIV